MRKRDLQPWLDYFGMLRTYEEKGFLEVKPDRHEAYVTQAALMTLLGIGEPVRAEDVDGQKRLVRASEEFQRRLRAYAAWKNTDGAGYLTWDFAMHIVKDDHPHDLLCTVVLSCRRTWRGLWMIRETFDTISYDEKDGR